MEKIKLTLEERAERAKMMGARRAALYDVQSRLLDVITKNARYLYEPTAEYLYEQMTGERKLRTYKRRKTLHERNNQTFRIIHLITEMVNETYDEE